MEEFRKKLTEEKLLEDKKKKEERKKEEMIKQQEEMKLSKQAAVNATHPNALVTATKDAQAQAKAVANTKVSVKKEPSVDYASEDGGGKVVAANKEAIDPGAVLNGDRNRYVRNPCVAKKFIVVELAQEIMPDAVTISDHELFSSSVRHFQVLGSKTYPVKNWVLLGELNPNPNPNPNPHPNSNPNHPPPLPLKANSTRRTIRNSRSSSYVIIPGRAT